MFLGPCEACTCSDSVLQFPSPFCLNGYLSLVIPSSEYIIRGSGEKEDEGEGGRGGKFLFFFSNLIPSYSWLDKLAKIFRGVSNISVVRLILISHSKSTLQ